MSPLCLCFPCSLYFFTPLTPRSLAAPRGAGSSIGSGLLCNLGETRSYSNMTKNFTHYSYVFTILYTFFIFLDEILRKFFTRSLRLSILCLVVRLQAVSTLPQTFQLVTLRFCCVVFLHIAMLWSSQAMSGQTSLEAFQHGREDLEERIGWIEGSLPMLFFEYKIVQGPKSSHARHCLL